MTINIGDRDEGPALVELRVRVNEGTEAGPLTDVDGKPVQFDDANTSTDFDVDGDVITYDAPPATIGIRLDPFTVDPATGRISLKGGVAPLDYEIARELSMPIRANSTGASGVTLRSVARILSRSST